MWIIIPKCFVIQATVALPVWGGSAIVQVILWNLRERGVIKMVLRGVLTYVGKLIDSSSVPVFPFWKLNVGLSFQSKKLRL